MSKEKTEYYLRIGAVKAPKDSPQQPMWTIGKIYKLIDGRTRACDGHMRRPAVDYKRNKNALWEKSTVHAYKNQQNSKGKPIRYFQFMQNSAKKPASFIKGEIYKVDPAANLVWDVNNSPQAFGTNHLNPTCNDYWLEVSPPNDHQPIATTEEPTMANPVKVEKVVLIDDVRARDMSNDEIIGTIKGEQNAIDKLHEVKTPSKFISKQIKLHEKAIAGLIKILDAR